jgi:hypothetical protein
MDTDTGSDRDTDMDRNRARDTYIDSYFFTTFCEKRNYPNQMSAKYFIFYYIQ